MRKSIASAIIISTAIMLACSPRTDNVHDSVVIELPSGGDFHISEKGEGEPVKEGMVIEVSIDPMTTDQSYDSRKYLGLLLVKEGKLSQEQFELFTRMSVGDRAIVTFKYGSSLEVEVRNQFSLKADPQDSTRLAQLYQATGGPRWRTKWDTRKSVTTWAGVELNPYGKVVKIDLDDNGLEGTLPPSLMQFEALEWLYLKRNNLSGKAMTTTTFYEFGITKSRFTSDQIQSPVYYFLQDSLFAQDIDTGDTLQLTLNTELKLQDVGGLEHAESRDSLGFSGIELPFIHDATGAKASVYKPFTSPTPMIELNSDSALSKLHLISSVRESGPIVTNEDGTWRVNMDNDGYSATVTYFFENGIWLEDFEGYELSGMKMGYPVDKYSMKEVFLLSIRSFPEEVRGKFFKDGCYSFPTKTFSEDFEYNTLIVDVNEAGELITFTYESRECGEDFTLESNEEFIIMTIFGHC